MADRSFSSNLALPAILVAILAAIGFRTQPVATNSAPSQVQHTSSEGVPAQEIPKKNEYEHSAAYLLEEFFDAAPDELPSGKPWSEPELGDSASSKQNPPPPSAASPPQESAAPPVSPDNGKSMLPPSWNYHVRFLIETVPQPSSSALRYEFDSQIAAIQAAAEKAGYLLTNYDIPWVQDLKSQAGKSANDAPGGDSPAKLLELLLKPGTPEEPLSATDPGVMLFDKESKRSDRHLLVVFVVSEDPIHGVNKLVFRDALDQIAWLEGWKKRVPLSRYLRPDLKQLLAESKANDLRMVGPTFSGSAPSIRNTLEEWFNSFHTHDSVPANVRIVSGAATSISDQLEFAEFAANSQPVKFRTVRFPDPLLWQAVIQDLSGGIDRIYPDTGRPVASPSHVKIAILADRSVFGSNTLRFLQMATHNASEKGYRNSILTMAFPLHISEVRAVYSKLEQPQTSTLPQLDPQDLPMPDESGQPQNDVIPSFSARSADYDELELSKMLTAISREHIRFVGVVATDVEDLVFLIQRVRQYCPDATVFTTSTDLRLLHSQVSKLLDGMLVFSTYPLFSEHEQWRSSRDTDTLTQLSSEDAEGIYNATLHQLDAGSLMVEYGEPFKSPTTPVLWVSVVGQQEIWPLGFQRIPKDAGFTGVVSFKTKNAPTPINVDGLLSPGSFQAVFVFLTVVCLASSLGVIAGDERVVGMKLLRRRFAVLRWFFGQADATQVKVLERTVLVSAIAMATLATYTIGLGYFRIPLKLAATDQFIGRIAPAASILGSAGLLVWLVVATATLLALIRMFASWQWVPDEFPWAACSLLAASSVELVLALFFVEAPWQVSRTFALFAFLRASHLSSGVSPLMALIFAAISGAMLVCCLLRQRVLTEVCHATPGFLGFSKWGSFAGVMEDASRVVRTVNAGLRLPGVVWLSSGVTLAFAYYGISGWREGDPHRNLDGIYFYSIFLLSSWVLYTFYSLLLLRFVWIWADMHKLLRRLYFHPTRSAYEKLRIATLPDRPQDQHIRLFEPPGTLSAAEGCMENARALLRCANATDQAAAAQPISNTMREVLQQSRSKLNATLREADFALNVANWTDKNDPERLIEKRLELHSALEKLSLLVTNLFEPFWRTTRLWPDPVWLPSLARRTDEQARDGDDYLIEQANLFVTARVVDFLRQIFPHLKSLIWFVTFGVVAMVLATSVYPFPRHDTLLWVSWFAVLTVTIVSVGVFFEINRSRVVSMLSGTDPGRFNWDSAFVWHLMLYVLLPILTLLGAQFPSALGGFFSWAGGLLGGGANAAG